MKVLFTLFALLFSNLILANPVMVNKIVVFGDSLSDTGNLYRHMGHKFPQSPPYFAGRFSNGPIWVEHLAKAYFPTASHNHLFDHAFGAAGILSEDSEVLMSLKREIDLYLDESQGKADANSLYIVWIGANNYLGIPQNSKETLTLVNQGIATELQRLIDLGARNILVVNIPDIGRAPIASKESEIRKTLLSLYSKRHNALLLGMVNRLQSANPHVKLLHFDVQSLVDGVLDAPENYGFTNTTSTCFASQIEKPAAKQRYSVLHIAATGKMITSNDTCQGYLFFDPIHPTTRAHKMLADHAKEILDTAGIVFGNDD